MLNDKEIGILPEVSDVKFFSCDLIHHWVFEYILMARLIFSGEKVINADFEQTNFNPGPSAD